MKAAIGGLAALLWSVGAHASGPAASAADVAVLGSGRCDDPGLQQAVGALRQSLASRPGARLLTTEATIDALGGPSRGSLADLKRRVAQAQTELFQQAHESSVRTLDAVISDLDGTPPGAERWALFLEAQALRAWNFQKMGQVAPAEAALERVLRLEPSWKPDGRSFPPSVGKMARDVSRRLSGRALATVKVRSEPAGLGVFVDGRPMGIAPLTLQLSRGSYRIESAYDGRRGIPRVMELVGAVELRFERDLDGALFADAGPCLAVRPDRAERLSRLVQLSAVLHVRRVVDVRIEQPAAGERYLVASEVDGTSGQELREARVKWPPAGLPSGAVERLADFLTTGALAPPLEGAAHPLPAQLDLPAATRPSAKPEPVASSGTSGLRIASYAALGVGVLGAAAGTYFLLDGRSATSERDGLRAADGSFPAESRAALTTLTNRVDRDSTLTVVGYGVAAAGLVGGAVLFLVSGTDDAPKAQGGVSFRPTPLGFVARF